MFCFCTDATYLCTLRLFRAKFDPYLLRYILDQSVWVKSRKIVVVGHLLTVQTMFVCIFYWTVVPEFKGDLDTHTRTVCVPTTFAQVPPETDRSLTVHLETVNSNRTALEGSSMVHKGNRSHPEARDKTQDLYLQAQAPGM